MTNQTHFYLGSFFFGWVNMSSYELMILFQTKSTNWIIRYNYIDYKYQEICYQDSVITNHCVEIVCILSCLLHFMFVCFITYAISNEVKWTHLLVIIFLKAIVSIYREKLVSVCKCEVSEKKKHVVNNTRDQNQFRYSFNQIKIMKWLKYPWVLWVIYCFLHEVMKFGASLADDNDDDDDTWKEYTRPLMNWLFSTIVIDWPKPRPELIFYSFVCIFIRQRYTIHLRFDGLNAWSNYTITVIRVENIVRVNSCKVIYVTLLYEWIHKTAMCVCVEHIACDTCES